jgi:hypothetical protein
MATEGSVVFRGRGRHNLRSHSKLFKGIGLVLELA